VNAWTSLRGRGNRFQPGVESLEDRYCLTVSNPFSVVGTTLHITDPNAAAVTIRYEGVSIDPHSHAAHGHIVAGVGGVWQDFQEIDNVTVDSPAGSQAVNFRLDAPMTTSFNLQLGLGAGNSSDLDFSAGIQGASLYVNIQGGGSNTITSRFGAISNSHPKSGWGVVLNTTLGDGYNTFNSFLNGNISNSTVSLLVIGGDGGNNINVNAGTAAYAGHNTYTAQSSIDVDANSHLSIDLRGGKGNDKIGSQFVGTLEGEYSRLITSYDGIDNSSQLGATDIILPGSTGIYHGAIRGSAGHDNISQYLSLPPSGGESPGLDSVVSWVDTYSGHGSVDVSPGVAVYHNGNNPGIQNF
jgi:hypothetical protein